MTDPAATLPIIRRIDPAWAAFAVILASVALFDWPYFGETLRFTAAALLHTAPFIAFAVFAVAYLKATGAERIVAKVFQGSPVRMIFMAALVGGLAPFCSCEVIPFIAAMLALGAPLAAVMAFWLASPLMDPAMFAITSGTLGWEFALAKTAAAVGLGLMGGYVTLAASRTALFADPLRTRANTGGCCGTPKLLDGAPVWKFWQVAERRETFRATTVENGIFLIKWLAIAYSLEALMLRHVPAEMIANILGGEGMAPILLGALVGAPAYLNGYAAVPLISGLLDQGMSQGAAMAFVIAGGVSSIPAAIAVWALVKPRVFAAYIGFAITGAVIAGTVWQAIA
ncbi:permease [Roseovarius sp. LXJ103]|uniref:permease n=1 Tax=Roseovarius carneus TaxID=2853164 RepID=UPI000D6136A1|nr:permease [Roseovarius carneus]MBZ8118249.1 permease [Roseovarius carneus]PWE36030.1 permease [Pelagicola sp. LXJ1103]